MWTSLNDALRGALPLRLRAVLGHTRWECYMSHDRRCVENNVAAIEVRAPVQTSLASLYRCPVLGDSPGDPGAVCMVSDVSIAR
jgi:hypothetical protein